MSHYMTSDERQQLEAMHRNGIPVAEMARQLGFCRQAIYNELRRGAYAAVKRINGMYRDVVLYSADKGQQVHEYNQSAKGRPIKLGDNHDFANFLEGKILGVQPDGSIDRRQRYSPAAALAAAKAEGFNCSVCVATLYSYIDKGVFLRLTNKDLLEKGKRKRQRYRPVRRIAHPQLPSISDRPEEVNNRSERGYWEMDLVLGCRSSHAVLLTLTERKTREEIVKLLPNKKAETVRAAFDEMESEIPDFKEKIKGITTDNGSEFLQYEDLRKSINDGTARFDVWYCHSYASWEKGTVENHNRIIRRWFPKGTNFDTITQEQVDNMTEWMNHYPKKVLGWKCAAEM